MLFMNVLIKSNITLGFMLFVHAYIDMHLIYCQVFCEGIYIGNLMYNIRLTVGYEDIEMHVIYCQVIYCLRMH